MRNNCQTRYDPNATATIPPEDIPAAAAALGEINESGTPPKGNLDLLAQVDEILEKEGIDEAERTLQLANLYNQKLAEALNPVPPLALPALIVAVESFAKTARTHEPLAGLVADAFNDMCSVKDASTAKRRSDR